MKNLVILRHYRGQNRHVVVEYDEYNEIVSINTISEKLAEVLIKHGMNHGS